MKGKLTKLMMVAMVLVMALSLVTTALTVSTTTVSAADDKWSRMNLPSTLNYQMFPDSDIWDLTAADDGTLFALVEDTTGADDIVGDLAAAPIWDGLRWNIFPAYSDVAVFKSTDGGCSWEICWHLPSSETGVPVAIVPQPGYVDSDSSKNTVFVATGVRYDSVNGAGDAVGSYLGAPAGAPAPGFGVGNIYRALDGCNFIRVTPSCPGVVDGGSITSLDVVACEVCATGCQDANVALVGVTAFDSAAIGSGLGEGLYSWNDNGIAMWNDMQIANSMQAPPTPGTIPAGNGLNVLAVQGSPNYPTDKLIVAVVSDWGDYAGNAALVGPSGGAYGAGTYVCFWDGNDGYWGGDVNSPTNVQREVGVPVSWVTEIPGAAFIAMGTDFNNVGSCYVFVGFDGSQINPAAALPSNDTVWRIRGLPTVTGPSTSTNCNVDALLYDAALVAAGNPGGSISDLMIKGDAGNAQTPLYVACDYPLGQAQVVSVTGLTVWPSPVPSFKPMSGMWPSYVTNAAGTVFAAGGSDGFTTSGVHKMYDSAKGPVFNGRGILDDIAQSEAIPGYAIGTYALIPTEWCMAEALNMEASPTYSTDGLIYTTTWSEWVSDLSLWRLTDGCWERIMYEDIYLPGNQRFESKAILTTAVQFIMANRERGGNGEIWWPKVVPQFSTDGSMFVLGGRNTWGGAQGAAIEMLWYSADKGNSWGSVPQMPVGAPQNGGNGLSETGWITVDSNHLLLGDVAGRIYRTDNRGASWTPGVLTTSTTEINTIEVSPIYSITGAAGTDKVVLVGSYDAASQEDEVWMSQDACAMKILEHVGDELYAVPSPASWIPIVPLGGTVVQFDKNWATNRFVYAAAGGWLDRWELVGTGSGVTDMARIDYSDVCVSRIEVNLDDPYAATWENLWDADDYNDISPEPQILTAMALGISVYRIAMPSAIETGADGTVYVTFSVWDTTYNNGTAAPFGIGDNPSPQQAPVVNLGGRWTMSGALRCLDATEADAEFEVCKDGRGVWDGLWLGAAVPGSTQLISLTWDWKEWDWKLALWKDTLAGSGPAASGPADGATGVGTIMADTSISAPVSWQAQTSATLYEWQVSEDDAFTSPMSGTTSGTTVTVPGLQAQTVYHWRVRTVEPMLGRWSTVQEFTTVPGGDSGAPAAGKPEDGSTISDTTPLFTWGKVASATNYELQVATDPGFGAADIVINETLGDISAYEADKELVNGTYYWRVRGTNPATDTESPWSFGSFTLDTEAEGEGTPVWVWVLIIVGVLLAIIVLVLILRTRRPV